MVAQINVRTRIETCYSCPNAAEKITVLVMVTAIAELALEKDSLSLTQWSVSSLAPDNQSRS